MGRVLQKRNKVIKAYAHFAKQWIQPFMRVESIKGKPFYRQNDDHIKYLVFYLDESLKEHLIPVRANEKFPKFKIIKNQKIEVKIYDLFEYEVTIKNMDKSFTQIH